MNDDFYEKRKAVRVPEIRNNIHYSLSDLRMYTNWLFSWHGGTAGNEPRLISSEVRAAYQEAMRKIKDLEAFLNKPEDEHKK